MNLKRLENVNKVSTTRKIAAGSAVLMAGNALGYGLAMVKEIMVAARFGVSGQMDAFYAAITVPSLITNVFIATFGAVFIPVFTSCRASSPEQACRVADVFITRLLVFLAVCSGLLFLLAGPIISLSFPGFQPEAAAQAAAMLRQLSWLALLSGLVGMSMGILSVYKEFAPQAFAPLFVTSTIMGFIVFLGGRLGVDALAWGTVAGVALELAFLAWFVRASGFRFRPGLASPDPELKAMLALVPPFLAASAIGQVNTVVDRFMASGLDAGSISALGYAEKLMLVPTQVFHVSLTTAAFPFFAALAAENRLEELKTTLSSLVRIAAFVMIPVTVLLGLTGGSLVRLLFERGAFTPAATSLTSLIFVMYCLQLFFTAAQVLAIRVFLAMREMRVMVRIAFISTALNVALNLLFMRLVDPPAAGIALSTSVTAALVTLEMFRLLRRKIGPLEERRVLSGLAGTSLASLAAAAAAAPVYKFMMPAIGGLGALPRGAALAAFCAGWTALFYALCLAFGVEEASKLKAWLAGRFGSTSQNSL